MPGRKQLEFKLKVSVPEGFSKRGAAKEIRTRINEITQYSGWYRDSRGRERELNTEDVKVKGLS